MFAYVYRTCGVNREKGYPYSMAGRRKKWWKAEAGDMLEASGTDGDP